jgi:hypothetical protein
MNGKDHGVHLDFAAARSSARIEENSAFLHSRSAQYRLPESRAAMSRNVLLQVSEHHRHSGIGPVRRRHFPVRDRQSAVPTGAGRA